MDDEVSTESLITLEQKLSTDIDTLIQTLKEKYGLTQRDLDKEFVETLQSLSLESFSEQKSSVGSVIGPQSETKQTQNISYRYSDSVARIYIPLTVVVGADVVEYTIHIYNKEDAVGYELDKTVTL